MAFKIYKALTLVPVLGIVISIANNYVYAGDPQADTRFAPIKLWLRVFLVPIFASVALTFLTLSSFLIYWAESGEIAPYLLNDFLMRPGSLILSVLPSLLGFGIGVYALIFALTPSFLKDFKQAIESRNSKSDFKYGSVLVLNAEFAYPLVVLTIAIGVSIFQQAIPDSYILIILCWGMLWYSLISTLEIISVLFGLGEHSIRDKSKDDKK